MIQLSKTKNSSTSEQEIDWDETLVQAAANARGMGKLPKGMDLFVENRINP